MLYICPTPIGNLKDISLRVLETLGTVDAIACEDTRTSAKLLKHYDIRRPLLAYHAHNEEQMSEKILSMLIQGQKIALISDAGMPAISDPGERLVKKVIARGLPYSVLPGASAAITALVGSSLATQPYYFHGFLDRKLLRDELTKLSDIAVTMVFYESPHRLLKTLKAIKEVLGDRQITLGRELTKLYESYYHGKVSQWLDYFSSERPRGEFVIIVAGKAQQVENLSLAEVTALAIQQIEAGHQHKEVVKSLAKRYNIDRQTLYKATLRKSHEDV